MSRIPRQPGNPLDCGKCVDHYFGQPFLVEAAASVGIEHGKSTEQMLHEYFAAYHKRGHKAGA